MTEYSTGFLHGMLMLGIIVWIIGYSIWVVFKRKMIELIELEQAEEQLDKVVVMVEKVDGQIYCYNEQNEFVCQGANLLDLTLAYKKRYPEQESCVLVLKGETKLLEELNTEYNNILKVNT